MCDRSYAAVDALMAENAALRAERDALRATLSEANERIVSGRDRSETYLHAFRTAEEQRKRADASADAYRRSLDVTLARAGKAEECLFQMQEAAKSLSAQCDQLRAVGRRLLGDLENAHAMVCATANDEGECDGCKVSERMDEARLTLEVKS